MPTPQCTVTHYNPEVFPEMVGVSSHDIERRWKDGVSTYEIPFRAYDDDGELYFSGVFRPKASEDFDVDEWIYSRYFRVWLNKCGVTNLEISEDYGLSFKSFL